MSVCVCDTMQRSVCPLYDNPVHSLFGQMCAEVQRKFGKERLSL